VFTPGYIRCLRVPKKNGSLEKIPMEKLLGKDFLFGLDSGSTGGWDHTRVEKFFNLQDLVTKSMIEKSGKENEKIFAIYLQLIKKD